MNSSRIYYLPKEPNLLGIHIVGSLLIYIIASSCLSAVLLDQLRNKRSIHCSRCNGPMTMASSKLSTGLGCFFFDRQESVAMGIILNCRLSTSVLPPPLSPSFNLLYTHYICSCEETQASLYFLVILLSIYSLCGRLSLHPACTHLITRKLGLPAVEMVYYWLERTDSIIDTRLAYQRPPFSDQYAARILLLSFSLAAMSTTPPVRIVTPANTGISNC